jgi:cytosol alanyl aminopeptidase
MRRPHAYVVVLVLLALWANTSSEMGTLAQQSSDVLAPGFRLPDEVRPVRQAVRLAIDPREEAFSGIVDIDVAVRSPVEAIWLHATGLSIRDATLDISGRTERLRVVTGSDHVIGLVPSAPTVGPGPGRLRIQYDGTVSRRDMEGLFAQQEGDDWYVFTQFQPLGARRAFPCFDEPSFKIPWQLTLEIPSGDSGFSNTPEVAERSGARGTKTIEFAETRPMPSYLVAVAVGPFETVAAGKAGRKATAIRMLVPRGRSADAQWAVETTPRVLVALEEYFDAPYPYEKLDQVSVPVFLGAMENAGLVTYGQTFILHKPGEETISGRRTYVKLAAHELAHQWFGNLVTMAWWDDLWLNESFASWMAQRITSSVGPDWGIDVERVRSRARALAADSLATARQIRQPVETSHDIANAFDGITYAKGQSVLEMFEAWLGEDVFRRGIRQYIMQHEWRNATFTDFARALSDAAGRDVVQPLSSFLNQPGAPLVSVELKCDGGRARISLAQKRYLPLGSTGTPATWQVPVCVRYDTGGEHRRQCALLSAQEAEIPLGSTCPQWVLANDNFAGYYRAHHGDALLDRLLAADDDAITVAERVGLLGDLPALIRSGDVSAARALTVASRFASHPDRHIVESTMSIVRSVRPFVPREQADAYARLVRSLYGARARELGWRARPGEPEDTALLRKELVRAVGTVGRDAALVDEAVALTQRWLDEPTAIEADMVESVLQVAASSGDMRLFQRLYDAARSTGDRERRERQLGALGAFRETETARRALAVTLDTQIDPRESLWIIFALSSDPDTRELAYEFVRSQYEHLTARLPRGSVFEAASFLPFTAEGFCDEPSRRNVEAFFTPRVRGSPGGPRNLAQALESIDLCIAQRHVQEPSVAAFLSSVADRDGR